MTNFIASYGKGLVSLLIALIVLMFALKILKKAPIIGGIAAKAEDLATGE
jgi:hypothetical protein